MTFADRLKVLRKQKGIRQDDLAEIVGVSKGTVSVWERGLRIPENNTLKRMCNYFGVTMANILGEEQNNHLGQNDAANVNTAEWVYEDDDAASLTELVKRLVRLSDVSRKIIASTITTAYMVDHENGTLKPEGAYVIQISDTQTAGEREEGGTDDCNERE